MVPIIETGVNRKDIKI